MIDESGSKPWMPVAHRLWRDSYGRLNFTDEGGEVHVGVVPVQAFPIDSPGEHISLLSADGHELVFIEQLSVLDEDARHLVQEEIAQREFLPLIRRLLSVSTFSTPSSWQVDTDRGMNVLVLKGEEDIRRLSPTTLIVADAHGVQFLIRDWPSLDRHTRKLLDRFL
jgi:hypothetical protein